MCVLQAYAEAAGVEGIGPGEFALFKEGDTFRVNPNSYAGILNWMNTFTEWSTKACGRDWCTCAHTPVLVAPQMAQDDPAMPILWHGKLLKEEGWKFERGGGECVHTLTSPKTYCTLNVGSRRLYLQCALVLPMVFVLGVKRMPSSEVQKCHQRLLRGIAVPPKLGDKAYQRILKGLDALPVLHESGEEEEVASADSESDDIILEPIVGIEDVLDRGVLATRCLFLSVLRPMGVPWCLNSWRVAASQALSHLITLRIVSRPVIQHTSAARRSDNVRRTSTTGLGSRWRSWPFGPSGLTSVQAI